MGIRLLFAVRSALPYNPLRLSIWAEDINIRLIAVCKFLKPCVIAKYASGTAGRPVFFAWQ